MTENTEPTPTTIASAQVHLTVADATAAADWYTTSLGAVERSRITLPDGKLIHLELDFGPLTLMVADEFPDYGSFGPNHFDGTYSAIYLFFDDVQAVWDRAVTAGASIVRPLAEVSWGDLDGQILDPFGARWGLAQHVRDVPLDEMAAAAAATFGATS